MAKVLIVPVCPHVNKVKKKKEMTEALPDAAVFNVL